jgi:hypothetical protein
LSRIPSSRVMSALMLAFLDGANMAFERCRCGGYTATARLAFRCGGPFISPGPLDRKDDGLQTAAPDCPLAGAGDDAHMGPACACVPVPAERPLTVAPQLHFGDAFCDSGTFAACPETGQLFCCSVPGAPAVAAACNGTIPAESCPSNVDLLNCACPLETTFADFVPFLTAESWQNVPYDPQYVDGGATTCNSTGRCEIRAPHARRRRRPDPHQHVRLRQRSLRRARAMRRLWIRQCRSFRVRVCPPNDSLPSIQ